MADKANFLCFCKSDYATHFSMHGNKPTLLCASHTSSPDKSLPHSYKNLFPIAAFRRCSDERYLQRLDLRLSSMAEGVNVLLRNLSQVEKCKLELATKVQTVIHEYQVKMKELEEVKAGLTTLLEEGVKEAKEWVHKDRVVLKHPVAILIRYLDDFQDRTSFFEFEVKQSLLPDSVSFSFNPPEGIEDPDSYKGKLEKDEKQASATLNELLAGRSSSSQLWLAKETLADVYIEQGRLSEAKSLYGLVLKEKLQLSEHSADTARAYFRLGQIARKSGQLNKAQRLNHTALEILQEVVPMNHPDIAKLYYEASWVYISQGNHKEALVYYNRANDIQSERLQVGDNYHTEGFVLYTKGQYRRAMEQFLKAMEVIDETFPANHPKVAEISNDIGLVYFVQGQHKMARVYYSKALDIRMEVLPGNHPDLALSYNNMGTVHIKLGLLEKAKRYLEEGLKIREIGPSSAELGASYNKLALVYHGLGQLDEALKYFMKGLELRKKDICPNRADIGSSCTGVGMAYISLGQYDNALSILEEGLNSRTSVLPATHVSIGNSYYHIGRVYYLQGELSLALSYIEDGMRIRKPEFHMNPDFADFYIAMGRICLDQGQTKRAQSYFAQALDTRERAFPPNHPSIGAAHLCVGFVWQYEGKHPDALACYQKALKVFEQALTRSHMDIGAAYHHIGRAYHCMEQLDEALRYYELALEEREKVLPRAHPDIAVSLNRIGRIYQLQKKREKALPLFEKALKIIQGVLPSCHPLIATFSICCAEVYPSQRLQEALDCYRTAFHIRAKFMSEKADNSGVSGDSIQEALHWYQQHVSNIRGAPYQNSTSIIDFNL